MLLYSNYSYLKCQNDFLIALTSIVRNHKKHKKHKNQSLRVLRISVLKAIHLFITGAPGGAIVSNFV